MSRLIDLKGKKLGRLTVVSREASKNGKVRWLCKCTCGNFKTVTSENLKSGHVQSCGCYHMERITESNKKSMLMKSSRDISPSRIPLSSTWLVSCLTSGASVVVVVVVVCVVVS